MSVRAGAAVAVLLAALVQPASAAETSPRCDVFALSPDFANDRTALCAAQAHAPVRAAGEPTLKEQNGPVVAYLTTNAGRTWRQVAGVGLPASDATHSSPTLAQVAFSPQYPVDGALYVWAASDGLFQSRDAGATWTQSFLPLSGDPGTGILTPISAPVSVDPVGSGEVQAGRLDQRGGGFAYAFENTMCASGQRAPTDAIVVFPDSVPATGASCFSSLQYLLPRAWPKAPALLLDNDVLAGSGPDRRASVHLCDPLLSCRQQVLSERGQRTVQGWPDPLSDSTFYVETTGNTTRMLRSVDGGLRWSTWTSVQRLLDGRGAPRVWFAGDERRFTLFVRGLLTPAESGTSKRSTGLRVYDSADRGASWRLVAVQPDSGEPGRGTLPFDQARGHRQSFGAVFAADGRLFTLAAKGSGPTSVWCSLDRGRTWARLCPR